MKLKDYCHTKFAHLARPMGSKPQGCLTKSKNNLTRQLSAVDILIAQAIGRSRRTNSFWATTSKSISKLSNALLNAAQSWTSRPGRVTIRDVRINCWTCMLTTILSHYSAELLSIRPILLLCLHGRKQAYLIWIKVCQRLLAERNGWTRWIIVAGSTVAR